MSFVTVNGDYFQLDGIKWVPLGGTTYDAFHPFQFTDAHIDDLIDAALNGGFTTLRFVNFYNHGAGNDPMLESVWVQVDKGLEKCRLNGIKVLLDLSDYRNLLENDGLNPYTEDWTTYLTFVANRVNTINGRIYKNDDTIWSISLAGEPYPNENYTTSDITTFFQTAGPLLKSLDSNHLINPGGFNHCPNTDNKPDYKNIWPLSCFDYCAIHPYKGRSGILPESDWVTITDYAKSLNKPLFSEEWGLPQFFGDEYRANAYRLTHNRLVKHGGTGFIVWNIGKQIAPTSFNFHYSTTPKVWSVIKTFISDNYMPRATATRTTSKIRTPLNKYYRDFNDETSDAFPINCMPVGIKTNTDWTINNSIFYGELGKSLKATNNGVSSGGHRWIVDTQKVPNSGDLTLTAKIRISLLSDGSNGRFGIMARCDQNNGYVCMFKSTGGTTGGIRISKLIRNTETTIANSSNINNPKVDTWYNLKFILNGSTLTGKVWEVGTDESTALTVTTTDTTFPNTKKGVGYYAYLGTNTLCDCYIDDVKTDEINTRTLASNRTSI